MQFWKFYVNENVRWSQDNAAKTLIIMLLKKMPENDFFTAEFGYKLLIPNNWIKFSKRPKTRTTEVSIRNLRYSQAWSLLKIYIYLYKFLSFYKLILMIRIYLKN